MTKRRLSWLCAALAACICSTQTRVNADENSAGASAPAGIQTAAQDATQIRYPHGTLREDRSFIGQARPNARHNTRKVYPTSLPLGGQNDASPRGAPTPCVQEPCDILIYDNAAGPPSIGAVGDNAGTPTYDDCALVGTDRFICRISLGLGGVNGDGTLIPMTLIVRSGNYFPICPEDSRSVVLYTATQNVPMTNPGNVINFDINPPIFLDENFFWIGVQTPPEPNDAGWLISGTAEIGFTENNIVIQNNNGTCEDLGPGQMDDYFWYGGEPWAGQFVQIFANPGPPGACCNRDMDLGGGMALCTDEVTRTACLNIGTTALWKPGECADFGSDPACAPCISQAGACTGATAEGETNCSNGYVDTYNADCSIVGLPTLACGQRICGTAGTYASACTETAECAPGVECVGGFCQADDSRDNDWYRIVLTESTEVTIRLISRFASQFTLMNNGGDPQTCTEEPLDFQSGKACETLTINRCLPAGTWLIRVRPDTFNGVPCDTAYRLELDCAGCVLLNGACCDASMTGCSDIPELACLGRGGQYQGDGTTCAVEGASCPGIPANDNCTGQIALSGAMVAQPFDTSFASDSTSPSATPNACDGEIDNGTGVIRKDVFFRYQIPTNFNGTAITVGDVVISTNDQPSDPHNATFDTWVVVYGDPSLANACNAGTLCSRPQYDCSDDILDNGTNFKYNSLSHLTIPVVAGSVEFFEPGECILIRIGRGGSPVTPASPSGGPGWLNIDFIPRSAPFALQTGRCCFEAAPCEIKIDDAACIMAGGFPRTLLDYNQGDPSVVEEPAGCKADPCPEPGEACYRALDFNALVGGDEGTVTRAITDILYYKYEVPAVGGIVIHTCGSTGFFDPIVGVYTSLESDGDCNLGSLVKLGDDCTSTSSAADGALTEAPCYGGINATADACLCLSVGPAGDVQAGQVIYIAYGSSNAPGKQFVFDGSPRDIVDPVTDPLDAPVNSIVSIATVTECFTCPSTCPGGSLSEGSDVICEDTNDPQPQDLWNGGCNASPPSFNSPVLDCSGGPVLVCGRAGNFRNPFPCDTPLDCPNNEPCSGASGFCIDATPFVNRDEDWFKIVINEPRTIRWRVVSEEFSGQLDIFADPEGDCDNVFVLATGAVNFACTPPTGQPEPLEVTASVCAGTYYLRITPSVFGGLGDTSCNAEYVAEASCSSFDQPTSCCPGDMNGDGHVNGLDIQKWIVTLFTPPTISDEFLGCFSANYCRADVNSSGAIDLGDLPDFVSLLVTSSKPVCTLAPTCTDPATSQLPSDATGTTSSDLDPSWDNRAADCFKPLESGSINTVCWWGSYSDLGGLDCGPEADCFQITFYSPISGCSNSGSNRCPGTRICPPTMTEPICSQYIANANRVATGGTIITPAGLVTEYFYTATLPIAVPVNAGQCYWIEIVNNTPLSSCGWVWEQSPQGDTRHAYADVVTPTGELPTDYSACNRQARDLAFSLNLRIDKEGCAVPQGRCCYDAAPLGVVDCAVTSEATCLFTLTGVWTEDGTCPGTCPPLGRCCYLDQSQMSQCVSTLQVTCDSLGGLWVEGASCPCPVGRCCVDGNCTANVTELECLNVLGGLWQQGVSCATACPTGICNNATRCQLPHVVNGLQQGGYVSDADNLVRTADDFRPSNTPGSNFISQVCWRGFHRQGTSDCGGDASVSETFTITYYAATGNLPNTAQIIGGPFNVTPVKSSPVPAEGVQGGGVQWQYETFHNPVPVTPAQCFWIEIVNTVTDANCVFLWATSNEGGNQKAAITKTSGAGAFPYQVVDRDLAFCVGPVTVSSAACTFSPPVPANDQCTSATVIGPGPVGPITGTTIGASQDPGSSSGCGAALTTRDVYYRWTQGPVATATTFRLCGLNTTFDSTISIHKTDSGVGGCPVSSAGTSQISVTSGCDDDGCAAGLGTNVLFFQGRQSQRVVSNAALLPANTAFLIRISGATKGGPSNNTPDGHFTLQITQP